MVVPSDVEAQEEQLAQEIDTESHEKTENFSFSKCQFSVEEEIEHYGNPDIKCNVVSDRKVEYQGEEMSLTAAAKLISGKKYSIAGSRFFKYNGEWLNDIKHDCDLLGRKPSRNRTQMFKAIQAVHL